MSFLLPPRDHAARAYLDVDALVALSSPKGDAARRALLLPTDAAKAAAELFARDPAIIALQAYVRDENNAMWLAEIRREDAHQGRVLLLWRFGSLDQFA